MNHKPILSPAPLARPENMVTGSTYRFTVLTPRLIRMEYQPQGTFLDQATQRVICRDFPPVGFRVLDQEGSLEIITDQLHLYYDKQPFSREGLSIFMRESFHVHGSAWVYGQEIQDLKGTARTLDEANGAIPLEPGLLSRGGYTVLDDSQTALMGEDLWPQSKETQSVDLYFFGYGHDYLGCLQDFYRLSGPTPMLPRFALGNWWSRYYKYSEESYLALMDQFRARAIPFSTAVIDMDWHLVDIPRKYGSGWTGYTWNPQYFPNPRRFLDRLHDRGLKVTLNVHPADGVRAHEEAYLPMARELGIDYEKEDKIPFDASSRPFLEAYFRYLHHPHEEKGVDFWWLDWQQGSRGSARGIDTLWLLNHLHFLDSGRDGKTPLTFSRYAGIGSHRYPVGFSGDTHITWESLDFQPYFTANASNAGYTWWSHDIGGHMLGYRDDELSLRWVQFGVFSPILRLHSSNNEFCSKEPWTFPLETERAMTEFLRLRHRLIPYLYTMNHRTHALGLPLVQPMYYRNDEGPAYTVPNEYWFGSEMIVCPITTPADRESKQARFRAWLPEGDYIDLFTGRHYRGGRRLDLYRDQSTIPVLVRAGGILPLAKDFTTSHLGNPRALEIHVFQGGDNTFDLYEDREDRAVTTRFSFTGGSQPRFRAELLGDPAGILPEDRVCHLIFRGVSRPRRVLLEGRELPWQYDKAAARLEVTVEKGLSGFEVQLDLPTPGIAQPDPLTAIHRLLHQAQISYVQKTQIFEAICAGENLPRLLGRLTQMEMNDSLRGAVMELLLSRY